MSSPSTPASTSSWARSTGDAPPGARRRRGISRLCVARPGWPRTVFPGFHRRCQTRARRPARAVSNKNGRAPPGIMDRAARAWLGARGRNGGSCAAARAHPRLCKGRRNVLHHVSPAPGRKIFHPGVHDFPVRNLRGRGRSESVSAPHQCARARRNIARRQIHGDRGRMSRCVWLCHSGDDQRQVYRVCVTRPGARAARGAHLMGFPHLPHSRENTVLSKYFGDTEARTLAGWKKRGGYKALEKALGMAPAEIVSVVKESGLRGRGGAGFPTGLKWSFMKPGDGKPHYLCCNADESEPGTFKDREIMRWTPHALVEGCAIGSYAIGAETCYIYIRGEFTEPIQRMEAALKDAYAAGILGTNAMGSGKTINMYVHRGAGAYICGEETALMNSLEGKRGNPRIKPPFPAVSGVFNSPTTINNVETLAAVPHIINNGAAWYKQWMRPDNPKSTGTKLYSVCGNIQRPGNYEVPMGFPF